MRELQTELRSAAAMLLVAVAGLATAVVSGLALVPRVTLVEVVTTLAGAIGGGASLTAAVLTFRAARARRR